MNATSCGDAEAAADFIRKLRKRRNKLIYGDGGETFAVEGESMKKMLDALDVYEQKYLELFIGKTIESFFQINNYIFASSSI